MGLFCTLATMGFVLFVVLFVGRFDQRAAYRFLQLGQNELFESESDGDDHPVMKKPQSIGGKRAAPVKRGYISPYMRNQIAHSQHWRCKICNRELDASFDLDHIIPLSQGGSDDKKNLQAICHSPCHIEKSAIESSHRAPKK